MVNLSYKKFKPKLCWLYTCQIEQLAKLMQKV
ncbi:hypothetical protein V6Z11_D07G132000 [Gossypium hirsutum]